MVRNYKLFREFIRNEGYTGNFTQAQYNFLRDQGYSGALPDMWFRFLGGLGYTQPTLQGRMVAWEADGFVIAAFDIVVTGLSTDSLGDYGQVGSHASISYTIDPDNGTETVKWSASSNPADAATFGTGSSPTAIGAADGFFVYLHVTDGADTVTKFFPVRKAPATAANGLGPFTWTVDDEAAVADFTSDFTLNSNTLSYTISGRPTGVVDDGDGTTSGIATVVTSGSLVCSGTDEYGRVVTSTASFSTELRAQATAGAALDLTFPEDSAITPVDLSQNFTENGNTLTYLLVDTPPTGLSATGETLSGTPTTVTADANYTFQGTDEYGRVTSVEHAIEITSVVNPDFTNLTFADPGTGTPDTLTATYTYAGADTLVAYVATRNGGTALTAAQLAAGTGTFLERVVVDPFSASTFDLTGFTSTSEAATRIDMAIAEKNNGGISTAREVTVSGLDFTAPTRSSIATDAVDGTTVIVTYSENIYGTEDTADWTISGHTVSGVAISGTTVTLTITPAIANGDSDTLSYSGGDLADGDGNAVATFTTQAITNNVPSALSDILTAHPDYWPAAENSPGSTKSFTGVGGEGANRRIIVVWNNIVGTGDLTINGTVATQIGLATAGRAFSYASAVVPTGTTIDVVCRQWGRYMLFWGDVDIEDAAGNGATAAVNQRTETVSVAANGAVIGVAGWRNTTSDPTRTIVADNLTTLELEVPDAELRLLALEQQLSANAARTTTFDFDGGFNSGTNSGVALISVRPA